ncbi:MAG: replication initiator protein [Microviridae sp.]|nr:MAG: replication initiator protein [Microviridae sp.]
MKCITPLVVINPRTNQSIPVECGRCPECIQKRTSQWGFRLRKEGDHSSSSYFITLTYDTNHVPISPNGYMTLKPDDVTLWLKRLRKISKQKIKYYYVGEYGTKNWRPHYHMLIYNADMEDIEKTWKEGTVHYGKVTGASIAYSLKYMIKDGRIPQHKNDDRIPEFGRMSKGLGLGYLTADIMYWHTNKDTMLVRLCSEIDGKKVPLARYYKEKIFDNYHKYLIQQYAKELEQKNLIIREKTINLHNEVEAHKAKFNKMLQSKYKNKQL